MKKYPEVYRRGEIFYFKYSKDGKRYQKSTGEKSEFRAQKFVRKFVDSGLENTSSHTLEDYLKPWTDVDTNPKRVEATIYNTRYGKKRAIEAKRFMNTILKITPRKILRMDIGSISKKELDTIAQFLVMEYGKTSSASSAFIILKSIFNYAEQVGDIKISPARGMPNIRFTQTDRIAIKAHEIMNVVSDPKNFADKKQQVFFQLLALTGMRRGEAMALKWKNVKHDRIIIDSSYKMVEKRIGTTKTGVVRVIPMCETLKKIMAEWRLQSKHELVFTTSFGGYLNDSWVTNATKKIVKNAKQKKIWNKFTPHVLRHSLNTNLLVSGVNYYVVQKYLGWALQSASTQSNYTHVMDSDLAEVSDKIEELYQVNKGGIVLTSHRA